VRLRLERADDWIDFPWSSLPPVVERRAGREH
jgi:hypothetical protein